MSLCKENGLNIHPATHTTSVIFHVDRFSKKSLWQRVECSLPDAEQPFEIEWRWNSLQKWLFEHFPAQIDMEGKQLLADTLYLRIFWLLSSPRSTIRIYTSEERQLSSISTLDEESCVFQMFYEHFFHENSHANAKDPRLAHRWIIVSVVWTEKNIFLQTWRARTQ